MHTTDIYRHIPTYTDIHTRTYILSLAHTRTHAHMHIRTHAHTHTRTHVHTHTQHLRGLLGAVSTFTLYLASYSALALAAESWYGCHAHVCFVSGAVCVNACVRARARAHLRARVWLRVRTFFAASGRARHISPSFLTICVLLSSGCATFTCIALRQRSTAHRQLSSRNSLVCAILVSC